MIALAAPVVADPQLPSAVLLVVSLIALASLSLAFPSLRTGWRRRVIAGCVLAVVLTLGLRAAEQDPSFLYAACQFAEPYSFTWFVNGCYWY